MPGETTLTTRALGRATLARQMLLARERVSPATAIERLAGMQAQLARPPYLGLWSRTEGFARPSLTAAIAKRTVVRATLMRATLHLMSAADYRAFRPGLQPALDKAVASVLRARLQPADITAALAVARELLLAPHTFDDLRARLAAERPKADVRAMSYAVRCRLPLVQVPADGCAWGYPGGAEFMLAERWLGQPIDAAPDAAGLVLRYLAAFGPASVADAQSWSGLPKLAPTFEGLRPRLRTFRDDRGRELFDLPKAPRPDPDTAAPVRFLPEFDNLVLAHADRRRMVADEHRPRIFFPNLTIPPTFLVDGVVAGTWKASREKALAKLALAPFAALPKRVRGALESEGAALLRFIEPDAATHEVRAG